MMFARGGRRRRRTDEENEEEEKEEERSATSLSVGTAFGKIWECYSPRFQLTKYYRYGEMDACEKFWEDFYRSVEAHSGKPIPGRSRNESSSKKEEAIRACETKASKRDARAFSNAWEILEPELAKIRWKKRYGDIVPDGSGDDA